MTDYITPRFFRITLQDPDGVEDSIDRAVLERFEAEGLGPRRRLQLEEEEKRLVRAQIVNNLPHLEIVTLIFDAYGKLPPRIAGAADAGLEVLEHLQKYAQNGYTLEELRAVITSQLEERKALEALYRGKE